MVAGIRSICISVFLGGVKHKSARHGGPTPAVIIKP